MRRGPLLSALFVFVSALAPVLTATPASAEPVFPPGFGVTSQDSGQGEFNLTDFVFLPGGGMITSGKDGRLVHVAAGGQTTGIGRLPAATDGDLGLTGIDLATDYDQSRQLYAVYSYLTLSGTWAARLVRITLDSATAPRAIVNEVVVVDNLEVNNPMHSVGKVIVDSDGTLWFGFGDGANPFRSDPLAHRAQSLDTPHGKIFHVNANGTGVSSNPFYDATNPISWRSRTWAYGLRNPFRFTLHPDGTLYIGDVGQNSREEMNTGVKGANYGWPCWEGDTKNAFQGHDECKAFYAVDNSVKPLFDYGRLAGGGGSITGGEFALNGIYPEPYNNSMIFAEFTEKKIWTFETDAAHTLIRAPEGGTGASRNQDGAFGAQALGPVSFRRGPTGEIHWAEIYEGKIWRLSYAMGNRPPTARGRAEMSYGNKTVNLFGAESSDPDGDPLTYEWDFGDGSPKAFTANVTHTYPEAARYTATLTVRDDKGEASSTQVRVVLDDHEPTLLVTGPPDGKTYYVDEPISATATASDPEDPDLGADDVRWRADIIHCAGEGMCHTHPGRVTTGAEFNMPFPDHGTDVSIKVNSWVEDSVGHIVRRSFDAVPRKQKLTLTSAAPTEFLLDGEPVPSNTQVVLVAGSRHVAQAREGENRVVDFWAGTGVEPSTENPRSFRMPVAGDATMEVRFRQVGFDVSVAPSNNDGASFHALVKPSLNTRPGDAWPAPYGIGCVAQPPVAGDDGDRLIEYGETWRIPCNLGPRVTAGTQTFTMASSTIAGGSVTGSSTVPVGLGYRMVASDGGIFSFGEAPFYGSMGGTPLNQPVVGMAASPSGFGYWMVASDGGIFTFGDAGFYGSMGGAPLPAPVVGMAPTLTGRGYWLVTGDGSMYAFGDAKFHGGLNGVPLAAPIVGIAVTQTGRGYWLVASDGGVFSFGDAAFFGSMGGQPLNQPIVGMTPTGSGNGYWQVALDGGVFSFGDAPFHGSMGGQRLNEPVVGMAVSPSGDGYWQVATDGGMFSFGDAPFLGSMGGTKLNQPVNGMTPAVLAKL